MRFEFEILEVTIGGVRSVVKTAGSGPAILFLHGASTLEGWDALLPLATRFTILAPSHPGFGLSGDAPQLASMGDLVVHYRALIQALGLVRPHLIGFSMGGWLAAELAAMSGESFGKWVLLAPAGLHHPQFPMADLAAIPPAEFPAYLAHDSGIALRFFPEDEAGAKTFAAARTRESEAVQRLTKPFGFGHPNLARWLENVANPCLIAWGKRDRIIPVETARLWRDALPQVELVIQPQAGHLLLQEAPEMLDKISKFLQV